MNHLRLTVSSVAVSARLYLPFLAALGYSLHERSLDRIAWRAVSEDGGVRTVIISLGAGEHPKLASELSPGLHHFAFNAESRDQVDHIYGLLYGLGAQLQDPPREYEYQPGYYAIYVRDPDNIKLEVVHVPLAA